MHFCWQFDVQILKIRIYFEILQVCRQAQLLILESNARKKCKCCFYASFSGETDTAGCVSMVRMHKIQLWLCLYHESCLKCLLLWHLHSVQYVFVYITRRVKYSNLAPRSCHLFFVKMCQSMLSTFPRKPGYVVELKMVREKVGECWSVVGVSCDLCYWETFSTATTTVILHSFGRIAVTSVVLCENFRFGFLCFLCGKVAFRKFVLDDHNIELRVHIIEYGVYLLFAKHETYLLYHTLLLV